MFNTNRRNMLSVLANAGILVGAASLGDIAFSASKIKQKSSSVLLVIDVQNCFIAGGTLPVKGSEEVVPVINKLAGSFENIVVTQDWHTKGHASFASSYAGEKPFGLRKMAYGDQVLWSDHCVQGAEDAALHKDLKLAAARLIVRKRYHPGVDSYSAFMEADAKTATGLGGYLKQRGIKTVYVTGLATDFCVAWTAMDARKMGFEAFVIEDATRAIDLNGSLAAAWKSMSAKGVKRIQSTDFA